MPDTKPQEILSEYAVTEICLDVFVKIMYNKVNIQKADGKCTFFRQCDRN